LFESKV